MEFRHLQKIFACIACWGMVVSPLVAAEPQSAGFDSTVLQDAVLDVTLDEHGRMYGELRDAGGQPSSGAELVLWHDGKPYQKAETNSAGRFAFGPLHGGTYRVAARSASVACRAWAATTAPPRSREALLIVTNSSPVRGQQPINEVFCFNPFLMGTIIAAAIAIPIAVHNSGSDQASGS